MATTIPERVDSGSELDWGESIPVDIKQGGRRRRMVQKETSYVKKWDAFLKESMVKNIFLEHSQIRNCNILFLF